MSNTELKQKVLKLLNRRNDAGFIPRKDTYENYMYKILYTKIQKKTLEKYYTTFKALKALDVKLSKKSFTDVHHQAKDLKFNFNFTHNDISITKSKFKDVAEERIIKINKPLPEDGNLTMFMKKITPIVNQQMKQAFAKYGTYKIIFGLDITMYSDKLGKDSDFYFHSGLTDFVKNIPIGVAVLNMKSNESRFHKAVEATNKKIEEFQQLTSDWQIVHVKRLIMKISKYTPAHGSSYIELPEKIANKKCCVNIQNEDNRCFEYSVLCGLHHEEIKKDLQRVSKYKPYANQLKFDGIDFPVEVDDVSSFEEQNEIPINVFGLDADAGVMLLHAHTFKCEKKIINLLLIENEDKSHYVYVKNLNALFALNKCNNFICSKCLQRFSRSDALEAHVTKNRCVEFNGTALRQLPEEGRHSVEFRNTKKQLRVPFVLYADCESILKPVQDDPTKNTQIYQNHHVNHVGVKLVSDFPDLIHDEYKQFDGSNCMIDFLNYCLDTQNKCLGILHDETHKYFDRKKFLPADKASYNSAVDCHICQKKLNDDKVLDHCHITGKYRGPAHYQCNINYNYKDFQLPVFFHNLKGYDSHFIIQYAGLLESRLKGKNLSIIPTTMEKYLSFTIDKCVFLDSCQFINSSLEKLVESLNKVQLMQSMSSRIEGSAINVHAKSSDNAVFKHFNAEFPSITHELNDLLRQKGIFPYDWFDGQAKLNETALPGIESFYSQLYEQEAEVKDVERAQKVWSQAGCKTFYDYLTLYLKTDVLLLADVFEAFRKMCLDQANYGLDPCHYYTAPGFSWDSMLKMTGVSIECFKEGQDDMLDMIQKGMRGGISMISTRYAKANNKYMKSYDSSMPSSHIMYLDANNLYGWAMSQYLPTGNFNWVDAATFTMESIMNISNESETGYIFEYDVEIPEDKHDYFNDYPVCPESYIGEYSPTMKNIMQKYKITQSNDVEKLIPNLYAKSKYVSHYRNLQLYVQLGVKVTKIHRVLSFNQSDYLKKYIDFNTTKRAQSKNDFEKDLYKLFNNSVFGKTMENVEKRIDCSLVCDSKKFLKLSSKPHFKNFKIYSEGLIACEMAKTKVVYNRPMIVGMCILDLSKTLMYDFHYNTMMKKYGNKCKLLFTDTDSLCYHIQTEDVYADMKTDKQMFDFSDYPTNHFLFDESNKKVIGKFKDEANGKPIIEFCGLRSKMYSFLTESKVKCTAKGIQRNKIKTLTMEKYKLAIFGTSKDELQQSISFNSIRQTNHQLNTVRITKTSLSGIDNKRYILEDNIHTRALGHKNNL